MASTFIKISGEPCNDAAAAGVTSFNGRSGVVTSQPGDYSAEQISYDNTNVDLDAVNVQDAIDELATETAQSASPGFSFGRAGSVLAGTYLQCETVPSNVAGRWVFINSAFVEKVFVSNELNTTFTLEFYYHDGNSIGETSLGTITVSSAYGGSFPVNWPVPVNKQLSVKVSANSAKNIVCGLSLRGSV